MLTGAFVGLDGATLATMKTEWLACLSKIATGNQSYSISGRSFTRANLAEVRDMVAEIQFALDQQAGAVQRVTYADMSS
jgi:hypothetical protein